MISIWHWHTEPLLVGGLLLMVWAYGMCVGPFRHLIDPAADFPKREAIWFGLAVASFYGAVGSPIDAAGENFLFSAHMLQHNILMYLTPIFGIKGVPGELLDALLRRFLWLEVAFRALFHPVFAGFCFTFVFCGWHFPYLYELALHDRAVHVLEHLMMFGTSFIMLWPIFSASAVIRPSAWGIQVLYIFLLMVAQIPLFAILTFAENPLYPTYELAPRLISWLDPLQDQVLGGLIMKVANMLISLWIMARAFILWNRNQSA